MEEPEGCVRGPHVSAVDVTQGMRKNDLSERLSQLDSENSSLKSVFSCWVSRSPGIFNFEARGIFSFSCGIWSSDSGLNLGLLRWEQS